MLAAHFNYTGIYGDSYYSETVQWIENTATGQYSIYSAFPTWYSRCYNNQTPLFNYTLNWTQISNFTKYLGSNANVTYTALENVTTGLKKGLFNTYSLYNSTTGFKFKLFIVPNTKNVNFVYFDSGNFFSPAIPFNSGVVYLGTPMPLKMSLFNSDYCPLLNNRK